MHISCDLLPTDNRASVIDLTITALDCTLDIPHKTIPCATPHRAFKSVRQLPSFYHFDYTHAYLHVRTHAHTCISSMGSMNLTSSSSFLPFF